MKKTQTGFSAIEALVAIAIVGLVGFTGWHVWLHKDSNYARSANTNTNASSGLSIPGEMKLPLKKTIIYSNRDGGCHQFSGDFGPYTHCYTNTLLAYTPSGNLQADESNIAEQFVQQQRGWQSVSEVTFPVVPFSLSVNQLGSGDSTTGNAGICLIIIDKSQTNPTGCATPEDYQELRTNWPNETSLYTIGVIYITYR